MLGFLRRHRRKVAVAVLAGGLYKYLKTRRKQGKTGVARSRRGGLDADYFRNLWKLLKIVIPSPVSYESMLLVSHTSFLFLRTGASVYLAQMEGTLTIHALAPSERDLTCPFSPSSLAHLLQGRIVKALVQGERTKFFTLLSKWLLSGWPIAFVNAGIKYFKHRIATAFRERLTMHCNRLYMTDKTYYQITNLDSRITNPEQRLSRDIERWAHATAGLYGDLAKPLIDIAIYQIQLSKNVGAAGLGAVTLLIHTGTMMLQLLTPAFGRLVAREQQLEGEYTFLESRVVTNAEEIAFYDGGDVELGYLNKTFNSLVSHIRGIQWTRFKFHILEDFVVKYYYGACGFLVVALPLIDLPFGLSNFAKSVAHQTNRTSSLVTNRRLLVNSSDAFGRVMTSMKKVYELSGFTSRVVELVDVMQEMKRGQFNKEFLRPWTGRVVESECIGAEELSVVTPNGDVLAEGVTFQVHPGEHLMVVGPNGCGKTSLFRILADLFVITKGKVLKPKGSALFYIPQRPYLSLGNLRDQITYPHVGDQVKLSDDELLDIVGIVELKELISTHGGFDSIKNWKDVFSGGEKQRIALARLFYHKPRFALLDECTSAVSIDVENAIYSTARTLGISLMTISHRSSLWKHHNKILKLDGRGAWSFEDLKQVQLPAEQQEGKEGADIQQLHLQLEKEQLTQRLSDIDEMLKEEK